MSGSRHLRNPQTYPMNECNNSPTTSLRHGVDGDKRLWNHSDNYGPRTTNYLEGWHSKIKKHTHHQHPNIFFLIRLLKQEEASSEIRRIQYSAGGKRVNRKRKYIEIDNRLFRLADRLRNSEMTTMEFTDAASHLLHLE